MPHTTYRFPFEGKVLSALHRLHQPLAGLAGRAAALVLVLKPDGSLDLAMYPEQSHTRVAELEASAASFLFYDPFDLPEYEFVKWANIGRDAMERLMGEAFGADDFVGLRGGSMAYPETWGVMF